MKEALDLWRMQIHSDHMGDPDVLQEIGNNPTRDWLTAAVPLVRPAIAEVRHDRSDACGGSAAAGIGHGKQLDEMVVNRRRGRLHDKNLFAPNWLAKLNSGMPSSLAIAAAK